MIVQGTEEWRQIRLGKVTASRIADMVARTKSGWGASRANYAAELVAERLTGFANEGYINAAMQHGIDTEPEARMAYEFRTDLTVEQVGFIEHPTIPMTGASPDGVIGDDGMLELKCPNTATHIDTLLKGNVPGKYIDQMQWQMACAGRAWCDFASYDLRLPESMRLFVKRIPRDEDRIKELEKEVIAFLKEIETTVAELTKRYATARAA